MFGYIRPRRDTLLVRDYDRYRAAYCGLCRALGKRCGFAARFLVSYDMTFLYLLFRAPEKAGESRKCHCPAHVARHSCELGGDAMDLAADFSVLLYYWKLRDAVADERGLRRFGARLASLFLRRAYRKATRRHPAEDAFIRQQLSRLAQLEAAHSDILDAPADAFATLLTCLASLHPQVRVAQQLLYHVGRFIYLVDALDDLPGDCKRGSYNPLRYRFSLQDGALSPADRAQLLATIHASIGMAGAALELLEVNSGGALLHNIIYEGLPGVLQAVDAGKFQNQGKI